MEEQTTLTSIESLQNRIKELENTIEDMKAIDSSLMIKITSDENKAKEILPLSKQIYLSKAYFDTFELPDLMIEIMGKNKVIGVPNWVIFRRIGKREWKAVCHIKQSEEKA